MGWPGPMTDRQFLCWQIWCREQLNEPDRHDYYLMQVACEVARVLAKDPEKLQTEKFRLRFGTQAPTQETAVAHSKRVWAAVLGRPATPPPERIEEVGP